MKVFSVKAAFTDRSKGFYIGLVSAALLFVSAIVYLCYGLSVRLFVPGIFIVMLIGALTELLVIFTELPFMQLVPTLFGMLAFGLYLDERLEMFVLMWSGVYGMSETGAILWVVILILAIALVSSVLGIVSCFMLPRRTLAQAYKQSHAVYVAKCAAEREELLSKERNIVAMAGIPVSCRMLSAKAKGFLTAVGVTSLVVALVIGGVSGYFINGGTPGESAPVDSVVIYGITVSNLPDKLEYNEGDMFDSSGMAVTAYSSDGNSYEVDGWYTSVDGKALELIDSKVDVSYQGFTSSFSIHIQEAATSGIFNGKKNTLKFKENGVVQSAPSNSDEFANIGTWQNVGSNVTATLDGVEYKLSSYEDIYYFEYDGERLSSTDFDFIKTFEFRGPSQYGSIAGEGYATLKEDGTVIVSQSGVQLAEGTWRKSGQNIYVTIGSNSYTGYFSEGKYILAISASSMGYTFNYTMTSNADGKLPADEPTEEPVEKNVYITMTGNGSGAAEGRSVQLDLYEDGTCKLAWLYGTYELASYKGTWENGDSLIIHIEETDGTTTDYICMEAEGTYSFTWVKDKDSNTDYHIVLSGSIKA